MPIESRFTFAEFRELCFSIIEHAAWSLAARQPGRQPALELATSLHDRRDRVRKVLEVTGSEFGPVLRQIDAILSELIVSHDDPQPSSLLVRLCRLAAILETGDPHTDGPDGNALFSLTKKKKLFVLEFAGNLERAGLESMSDPEWAGLSTGQQFLAAVTQMCANHRAAGRLQFPPSDTLALERGVQIIERGTLPPRAFAPIQTSDRRPFQTYLSLADPGPGHLEVTVRDAKLLRGTMVHIETIDRGKIAKKSLTEAYRIPSIRHVARIRLIVGDTTPCTVYIGRPTFESKRFENDLLKSSHTIAAACSAMFGLGVADCKIAMDGMTATESMHFMQAVAGNSIRDRFTQRLSAAFNLNSDLIDDRTTGQNPVTIKDRYEIAKCSIELTRLGGFDKVTWDGAADGPSVPLIPDQLSELRLLELVHEAHGKGLETYISAGMDAENMGSVTAVGVGGVGIGTKLHDRDPGNQAIGRILPDKVRAVLANRDQAADQPPGIAASALARLDWFFNELQQNDSLSFLRRKIDALRSDLFRSLSEYWSKNAPGERVALHEGLSRCLGEVGEELAEIRKKLPASAVPSSWQPYTRTLGGESVSRGTTFGESPSAPLVGQEPMHPILLKALFYLAACEREVELRREGGQENLPALVPADRIEVLRRLIEENDLPGIQAWFLA